MRPCVAPPALARSIFGLFSVPTWAFPWALLVIWQLLVPRASLLGHLTGLLVSGLPAWRRHCTRNRMLRSEQRGCTCRDAP